MLYRNSAFYLCYYIYLIIVIRRSNGRVCNACCKPTVRERTLGEAVNQLLRYMPDASGFNVPHNAIRATQLAAMNERFQERVDKIKLVRMRASEAGISEIRELNDVVPLLLPHTAYKSYPESFLTEQRWDRLTKWLGTVSAYPADNVPLDDVAGIDQWIERLGQAGHFVCDRVFSLQSDHQALAACHAQRRSH